MTLTLTPAHHAKVSDHTKRLHLSRADLIGLLIERYAHTVDVRPDRYARLQEAINALGGTLQYKQWNGPHGRRWLLTLGTKGAVFKQSALDNCFARKDRVAASRQAKKDNVDEIDPVGLAELFKQLAAAKDSETD